MNIVSLKLILLIAIFASGWIGGLIPLRGTNAQSPRFLSLGNAFAAGIFLGIGLIHMLGDASDTWTTSLGYSYPMGLLLAGGAFLAFARSRRGAEMLVLSLLESRDRHGYEIAKLIESRSQGVLDFRVASLYPLLKILHR